MFRTVSISNFEKGNRLQDYSIEDFEVLDEAVLDIFAESFNIPRYRNVNLRGRQSVRNYKIIVDRWSMELTQQQLNNIWRMIDKTVRNYEANPRYYDDLNRTVRAVIDDELYCSMFSSNEILYSQNFKVPLKERRITNAMFDINLLKLAYQLAELAYNHTEGRIPHFPRPTQ